MASGNEEDGSTAASRDRLTASDTEANARFRMRAARGFVFDMDGVLYRGNTLLSGVNDLFNALELREKGYILATNNSMSSPSEYVAKLVGLGVEVSEDRILTAGTATRDFLSKELPPGSKVYTVGMPALHDQIFDGTSFQPVNFAEELPAAVVVGLDLNFTYDKLRTAATAIRAGARFVATNADATLPTEQGLVPGAGSIVAAIATAAGKHPTVIGKPSARVLEQAMDRLGVGPAEAVMVGDRLDTDITAGNRARMLTVLVLTGVSTRDEISTAPVLPDLVFTDLPAMLDALVGNDA
jgi:4-nitrophenyl phosphatase